MSERGHPDARDTGDISLSTPAVISWHNEDLLTDVLFEFRRIKSKNIALFQLRFPVALADTSLNKTYLFLVIHPRDIQTLSHQLVANNPPPHPVDQQASRQTALHELGSHSLTLNFSLNKSPVLICPMKQQLSPRNDTSGCILEAIRALSCKTEIEFSITHNVLTKEQLRNLYVDLESRSVGTIADDGFISRLYRGQGGRIISNTAAATLRDDFEAEDDLPIPSDLVRPPLPLYNEVSAAPPAPPFPPLYCMT